MAYNPQNPNGQTDMGNSAPVVIASNQSAVNTKLTDGTNTANVISTSTANSEANAVVVAQTTKSYSFSYSAITAGTTYDVGNFSTVKLQITSQYSSSQVNFQSSNDGTNWYAQSLVQSSANNQSSATSSSSSGVMYAGSLFGRYFRLNITGTYSSGTCSGVLTFSTAPLSPNTFAVQSTATSASLTGNITTSTSSITTTTYAGYSWASISVHGTYAGVTFGITCSDDAGTTYYNIPIFDVNNNKWLAGGSSVTPATNASATYIIPIFASGTFIKVLASAYTSGTASIKIIGSSSAPANFPTQSQLFDSNGTGISSNLIQGGATSALNINNSAVAGVGFSSVSGSITNALTAVKATGSNVATTLYGWYFYNNTSTTAYCQIFDVNAIASVTLGTTAPTLSFGIPSFGGANAFPIQGIKFSNGIVIAMTTTRSGSTAPGASIDYNIFYQ